MKEKIILYCKKNLLQLSILLVGILILIALILNLAQGGFWIVTGLNGKSAYELAVENGYEGSQDQWLSSLAGADGINGTDGKNGIDGTNGKTAYEIACENGFVGSEQEWLLSLQFGKKGEDGKDGANGLNGKDGKDGVGMETIEIDENGHLIIWLTNGKYVDLGLFQDLINE